ncbi:MAG: hypothetical protein J2O38_01755 [Acidimicrobiales bacterium]|nr:hypothetical protein [Acidimicrobiales bacterium]
MPQIHAFVSRDSAHGWNGLAVKLGVTTSSLVEAVGQLLAENHLCEKGVPELDQLTGELAERARTIDALRRQRKGRLVGGLVPAGATAAIARVARIAAHRPVASASAGVLAIATAGGTTAAIGQWSPPLSGPTTAATGLPSFPTAHALDNGRGALPALPSPAPTVPPSTPTTSSPPPAKAPAPATSTTTTPPAAAAPATAGQANAVSAGSSGAQVSAAAPATAGQANAVSAGSSGAQVSAQVGASNAQAGAAHAQLGSANAQTGAANAQAGAAHAQLGSANAQTGAVPATVSSGPPGAAGAVNNVSGSVLGGRAGQPIPTGSPIGAR